MCLRGGGGAREGAVWVVVCVLGCVKVCGMGECESASVDGKDYFGWISVCGIGLETGGVSLDRCG